MRRKREIEKSFKMQKKNSQRERVTGNTVRLREKENEEVRERERNSQNENQSKTERERISKRK